VGQGNIAGHSVALYGIKGDPIYTASEGGGQRLIAKTVGIAEMPFYETDAGARAPVNVDDFLKAKSA
jgi:hypothetical protein